MICISVGDAATYTVIVVYGRDGSMVTMRIPPDGVDQLSETLVIRQSADMFDVMEQVLSPGLDALPPPPAAEACRDDTIGAVAISLVSGDQLRRYDAPCATAEVLALNQALIAATGDPLGEAVNNWTTPVIPAQRDMCRGME